MNEKRLGEKSLDILAVLKKYTNEKNILINEPMKNHTTFKIGGNADFVVLPENIDEVINLIKFLKEEKINYFVMGNGSNLLVKDEGYRGVIIKLGSNFSDIKVSGNIIKASSGALLTKISNIAQKESLKGFEELSGIPGSLGGAIYMNAGAYGKEIKNLLKSVTFLNENLEVETRDIKDLKMEYRKTLFSENKYIVLEAQIELEKGDSCMILERIREVTKMRTDKQPLNFPSAGSTFKRPVGHFAGKLIEDANLKGYTLGGAKVSEKHAGFIINYNSATFLDVINLTEEVKKIVKEKFNVELELEVEIL
ncbi:MAG: UDP-N-acetylmuramate dehydrogenase [Clostridia bacterium]|nr:UDP-N-acetylmuramate dehydrogenase [Clostridia bacterium]